MCGNGSEHRQTIALRLCFVRRKALEFGDGSRVATEGVI